MRAFLTSPCISQMQVHSSNALAFLKCRCISALLFSQPGFIRGIVLYLYASRSVANDRAVPVWEARFAGIQCLFVYLLNK